MEQIASQLLRKAAVGTSTVHLQLGAGKYDGGELLLRADSDGLDIRITPPAGVDGASLASAIATRLERRGLRVARMSVE